MISEIQDRVHDTSSLAAIKHLRRINMALHRVNYDVDFPQLRRDYTLNVVANTRDYVLPSGIMIPNDNWVIPSIGTSIRKVNRNSLEISRPGLASDPNRNSPNVWCDYAWSGVSAQPSAASKIKVTSDSTEASLKVTVEGVVSGEIKREMLNLNGTTANATTAGAFTEIHSVSKGALGVGILTITADDLTGKPVLGTLGSLQYTRKYINVRLDPCPDQSYAISVNAIPWLPDLVNDSDVPLLPEYVHEAIVFRALMYSYPDQSNQNYRSAAGEYQDLIEFARRESGRDEGKIKAWIWGGTLDQNRFDWSFDMWLRTIYWGF